ncbi:hypothetical protein BJX62DRAFT_217151 [Aspergillus germanicus]
MSWADEKERLLATARFEMDKEARRLKENVIKIDMQSRKRTFNPWKIKQELHRTKVPYRRTSQRVLSGLRDPL